MCFYANPRLGHPISGCQRQEEEFKNMSALMSTLKAHVLLSLVITHWAILNKSRDSGIMCLQFTLSFRCDCWHYFFLILHRNELKVDNHLHNF